MAWFCVDRLRECHTNRSWVDDLQFMKIKGLVTRMNCWTPQLFLAFNSLDQTHTPNCRLAHVQTRNLAVKCHRWNHACFGLENSRCDHYIKQLTTKPNSSLLDINSRTDELGCASLLVQETSYCRSLPWLWAPAPYQLLSTWILENWRMVETNVIESMHVRDNACWLLHLPSIVRKGKLLLITKTNASVHWRILIQELPFANVNCFLLVWIYCFVHHAVFHGEYFHWIHKIDSYLSKTWRINLLLHRL